MKMVEMPVCRVTFRKLKRSSTAKQVGLYQPRTEVLVYFFLCVDGLQQKEWYIIDRFYLKSYILHMPLGYYTLANVTLVQAKRSLVSEYNAHAK